MTPSILEVGIGLIGFAILVIPPGMSWAALVAPGTPSGIARVGLMAATGLMLSTIIATILAAFDVLNGATILVSTAVVTLAPMLGNRSRRGLRPRLRRQVVIATGVGIAIGLVVIVARSHLRIDSWLSAGTTSWYYAHLTEAVRAAGGFPVSLPEWGGLRPFQTDYAPFTAQSAAAFALMPGDLSVRMEVYRLGLMAFAFVGSALLFRRWVSSWTAILAATILMGTVRLDDRFLAFRPEPFAFTLALFALWLVDRAACELSAKLAFVAAIAMSLVLLSHAEVFVVMLPAVVAIALVRGPLPSAAARFGLGVRSARRGLARIGVVGGAVLGAVLIGSLANVAIAGEARLLGYATGGHDLSNVPPVPVERIPPNWPLTGDPTWDFNVAAAQPGQLGAAPPTSFTDPRVLPRTTLNIWPALNGTTTAGRFALILLVLTPLAMWRWLDARRRQLVVIWLIFGVGLFIGSWLLFERSDTYVPARAGGRRLMRYELMVPVMAAVIAAWMVDRRVLAAALRSRFPGWAGAIRAAVGPSWRSPSSRCLRSRLTKAGSPRRAGERSSRISGPPCRPARGSWPTRTRTAASRS